LMGHWPLLVVVLLEGESLVVEVVIVVLVLDWWEGSLSWNWSLWLGWVGMWQIGPSAGE